MTSDDKLLNKLKKIWESIQNPEPVNDIEDNQIEPEDQDIIEPVPNEVPSIDTPEVIKPEETPMPNEDKSLNTCGSIFSGIGGWEYGAKQVGLKPIFAFEFHQKYADAYKKSHGDHVTVGDVRQTKSQLGPASVDVLFSSPPCQNYSVAKANKDDERPDSSKDVGFVTIEIARKTNAKAILVENVVAYMESPVLNSIIADLGKDYHTHVGIVNAHEFGCPTSRKRMIATFVRKDLFNSPFVPKPINAKKDSKSWLEAVKDLLPSLEKGGIAPWQKERLDRWGISTLNFPLQISGNNASTGTFAQGKNVKVFRQANEPSFTIVKSWRAMNMTRILFKDGTCLKANPHCFARWQSFPDEIFANLPDDPQTATEMIGNAVPPQLCVNILKQLKSHS
jgi:DNA (cytosine-5)-methyltransferase 1